MALHRLEGASKEESSSVASIFSCDYLVSLDLHTASPHPPMLQNLTLSLCHTHTNVCACDVRIQLFFSEENIGKAPPNLHKEIIIIIISFVRPCVMVIHEALL